MDPDAQIASHQQVIQMGTSLWISRLIYAAAHLKLADHLADGPQSAEALASRTATHARSLYRLLRCLASFGLFAEDEAGLFHVTPLGASLRSGASGAARATIPTMAGPLFWSR